MGKAPHQASMDLERADSLWRIMIAPEAVDACDIYFGGSRHPHSGPHFFGCCARECHARPHRSLCQGSPSELFRVNTDLKK